MRKQIKLVFQIGLQRFRVDTFEHDEVENFKRQVADQACFIAGGCCTSVKRGYWVPGGDVEQDCYSASPVPEECFEVEITMNANKVNMAYEHMRYAIGETGRTFNIRVGWVHCIQTPVLGRHFNVEDDRNSKGVIPL